MQRDDPTSAAILDSPALPSNPPGHGEQDRRITILGVDVTDVTRPRAIEMLDQVLRQPDGRTHVVYFVNTHTLNLAAGNESFRQVLNLADCVFADGTGVRWAARLQGLRLRDNVNGTDLTPELLRATAGHGYRYFLLGADEPTVTLAARHAATSFDGWTQAGFHHGYLSDPQITARVIRQINDARADLLLVGMGNPIQENWLHRHRRELNVPLCLAVGGLFTYWAGDLRRAPRWLRRCGAEWLGVLLQQPHKASRYLLGNPLFLVRICREWLARRGRSSTSPRAR